MIVTKEINHAQLTAELVAADIDLIGLGQSEEGELWGYDQTGTRIELPSAAQAVIDAHEPAPEAPNQWSQFWSYVSYSEGPDDVLGLLEMVAYLNGGQPPEE